MSRSSTPQSMEEEDDPEFEDLWFKDSEPEWCPSPIALGVGRGSQRRLRLENPRPEWCSAPIALGVGREEKRRVLYYSRELLMLHSPVFERMLSEGNGFREPEPNAVIELPDDDPEDFNDLLWFMHFNYIFYPQCALRLASKYQMEDLIHFVGHYFKSENTDNSSDLIYLFLLIDGISLPHKRAAVFRKVCTQQCLDELRKGYYWEMLSETLRQELTKHYYDDQRKANGREGFCSIDVPKIQWPNLLTFESPAREHCGGVASLRLIVGRGKEKRVLYCSRDVILAIFPALREKLHNGCDSLELEDDSADGFVYRMNWQLKKKPWEAFSVHQQSAVLRLASKYQDWLDFRNRVDSSESFTLCHKLYLAEQCDLDDLQKKYTDAIHESAAKLDEARESEWWPQLSAELRSSFDDARISKDAPGGSESKEKKKRKRVPFAASLMYIELYFAEEAQRILRGNMGDGRQRRNALLEDIRQKVNKKHGVNVPEWFWVKHIKNLKGAAKKEAANRNSVSRATGGGPSGAHFKDPRIEIILATIAKKPSIEGTPGRTALRVSGNRTSSMRESAAKCVKATLPEHRIPSTDTRSASPIERDDDVIVLLDNEDDVSSSHSQEPTTSNPPNKRSRRDHTIRMKCDTLDKSSGPSSSQRDFGTRCEKVNAVHALAKATERQNRALREQIELLKQLKDLQK